jgi:hypothetical protein
MKQLIIVAEFDESKLKWMGKVPDDFDIIAAYNEYYQQVPWEAFEIALQDDNFKVTKAYIKEDDG